MEHQRRRFSKENAIELKHKYARFSPFSLPNPCYKKSIAFIVLVLTLALPQSWQNILPKIRKSSEVWLDQKTLISPFAEVLAAFVKKKFLEGRLDRSLSPRNFEISFLFPKIQSLKAQLVHVLSRNNNPVPLHLWQKITVWKCEKVYVLS